MHNRPSRARFCDSAVAKKEEYTIAGFWKKRLSVGSAGGRKGGSSRKLGKIRITGEDSAGWAYGTGTDFFREAPLTLYFGTERDLERCPILLVSAPGAVGKSTLAKRISHETGAVYIDLAESSAVGGNFLTGGLVKSGLYDKWKEGKTSALIDGLDEAILKLLGAQEPLKDFLKDVVDCSKARKLPTVLFGRVGAIHEAWVHLSEELRRDVPVLEIGYFGARDSQSFVMGCIDEEVRTKGIGAIGARGKVREAVGELLGKWREADQEGQNRFAGYAPVLTTVAKDFVRQHEGGKNISEYAKELEGKNAFISTHKISKNILEREQRKLDRIRDELEDISLVEERRLYTTEEQLDWLVSRIYGLAEPELDANLFRSARDRETYEQALENWLEEHPFLLAKDGGVSPINVVFEAMISVHALANTQKWKEAFVGIAEEKPNPFLSEFYFHQNGPTFPIQAEHVGIIYDSIRARAAEGERVGLEIEGEGDAGLEGEFSLERDGVRIGEWEFEDTRAGGKTLHLGANIENADIEVPNVGVTVGAGKSSVTFTAPVSVDCRHLSVPVKGVSVRNRHQPKQDGAEEGEAVELYAETYSGEVHRLPTVYEDAVLRIGWADAQYPWGDFVVDRKIPEERQSEWPASLRRLHKLVIAFRRREGVWASPRRKIDGKRCTKGTGRKIIDHAVQKGMMALDRDKGIYRLDHNKLIELTGCSRRDSFENRHRNSDKALKFVKDAVMAVS